VYSGGREVQSILVAENDRVLQVVFSDEPSTGAPPRAAFPVRQSSMQASEAPSADDETFSLPEPAYGQSDALSSADSFSKAPSLDPFNKAPSLDLGRILSAPDMPQPRAEAPPDYDTDFAPGNGMPAGAATLGGRPTGAPGGPRAGGPRFATFPVKGARPRAGARP
jgi:hypothetical protein